MGVTVSVRPFTGFVVIWVRFGVGFLISSWTWISIPAPPNLTEDFYDGVTLAQKRLTITNCSFNPIRCRDKKIHGQIRKAVHDRVRNSSEVEEVKSQINSNQTPDLKVEN